MCYKNLFQAVNPFWAAGAMAGMGAVESMLLHMVALGLHD
jgi:hypothetical protein